MRLRLDIGYDGTDFHGWAAQPGLRTVQGEIEAALAVLLRAEPEAHRLTVGGRTDAGVHARGQVAHLDLAPELAERVTARRLEGVLRRRAPDVTIHGLRAAPAAFDARFGALSRRYEYRVRDAAARRDPLTARFTAEVPRELDLDAMRRSSRELLGLQDFTTFCRAREGATAVRELLRFDWRATEDGAYAAVIEADAFCHSMVRALVGAVVAVGSARIDRGELRELRDARARTSRFVVMPAHGLSLEEISYPPEEDLAARAEQTRARRDPVLE
ncbi:tRNA pseudouridine(38-40) synthase TruA [Leucobacter weissii]|uniref:tRNA pseudouridine synthase A n=1 Tax=Leucobacter weissii TaxID=1983706 RepID=A0A939MNE5_9MICO|nr:tRNA pseudouridine(38-40) synthase TruA [Leucobacter weissii]MBO1903045.1 tRNA pseudouridine(38-40) synthase TruA [Leucobacter weissii]